MKLHQTANVLRVEFAALLLAATGVALPAQNSTRVEVTSGDQTQTLLLDHKPPTDATLDSDHNGLGDAWEILHFGHSGVDPLADPDGDGLANILEYQYGKDPNLADNDQPPDNPDVAPVAYPEGADQFVLTDLGSGLRVKRLANNGWLAGIGPDGNVLWHRGASIPLPEGAYSLSDVNEDGKALIYVDGSTDARVWDATTGVLTAVRPGNSQYGTANAAIMSKNFIIGATLWTHVEYFWSYEYVFVGDDQDGALWGINGRLVRKLGSACVVQEYSEYFDETLPHSAGNRFDAWLVNDAGDFVGSFVNDYQPLLNGRIPLSFDPVGLNNDGVLIGQKMDDSVSAGWWRNGTWHSLSADPTMTAALNNRGDVLAFSVDPFYHIPLGLDLYLRTGSGAGDYRKISIDQSLPAGWSLDLFTSYAYGANNAARLNDDGEIAMYALYQPTDAQGQPSGPPESHTILLSPLTYGLCVDANRDGEIKTDGSDLTSTNQSYRFWLNDDIDRVDTFYDSNPDTMGDESEYEEDDIGPDKAAQKGWQEDWKDNVANCRRDLEDFNRLVLDVGGLDESFKNGTLYLGLKWTDTNGTDPSIKLYKQYKPGGDLSYLTSDYDGAMQIAEPAIINAKYPNEVPATTTRTKIDGTETFVLPTSLWSGLPAGSIKRNFLFEVCTPGKGQLKIVILKQENGTYTEIGEGPGVWFDFKKIGDMYEQWSVGHGNGGAPDSVAARIPSLTGSGTAFRYDNPTPSPEEKKYILYVHGWNMDRWEKERFAETAYKRLWWQGYKGRFGVFTWPATYGFGGSQSDLALVRTLSSGAMGMANGTHFDRGEWTAWRSGAPLRQLLQTLTGAYNGELYVFSHSMGGIVVSEALRLQSQAGGGQIINTYVPSQAALSAHTYDATLSAAAGSPNALQWTYNHPSLPNGNANYGPQTPNVYGGWHGAVLSGGGGSSKAVGRIKNFYNRNDWALSAPVWQFNQLTKPDWPDPNNGQPYIYAHQGGPDVALSDARFGRQLDPTVPDYLFLLDLGTPAEVRDRYEIMAFAAESRVKAFGATDNVQVGPISDAVDLQAIWGADPRGQNHRTHRWHSGQFRNYIQYQRSYWKALLGNQGFGIPTTTLP